MYHSLYNVCSTEFVKTQMQSNEALRIQCSFFTFKINFLLFFSPTLRQRTMKALKMPTGRKAVPGQPITQAYLLFCVEEEREEVSLVLSNPFFFQDIFVIV